MEDGRTAVEVRAISRVTLWGAITNLVLAAIKIVVGVLGHSQALVADGIHSLSDLASDAVVYFASKEGSRGPDREHPYGHARVETLATVAMGVILGIVALGIIVDGVKSLWIPDSTEPPGLMVLLMAFASLGAKEGLYRWTLSVAQRVQSQLLKANAWHHRSDAASSLVVVIAVVGAMVGLPWLDAVGAIGIAAMIAWMGWGLGHRSVRELVDTGLEPDQVEETRNAIMSVEGVKALHMLRTRRMGGKALVDVHILLEEPRISVSEGHQIM
jgi:cation diffusion facilitator family transporter